MSGDLLDAGQVAVRLGVSRWQVLAWAREGRLPRVVLGPRVVRFDPADVDGFVAGCRDGLGSPQKAAGSAAPSASSRRRAHEAPFPRGLKPLPPRPGR
jgi:excisionase family DNA binding protein